MSTSKNFRAFVHYLLAGMAGLFFVVVLFTGLVYYLAVSDQQRVPELIERTCREQLGVEATFAHYRFQYLDYFPYLSLALEHVAMRNPAFEEHGRQLLEVDKVSVVFRPWKILRREFVVKTVVIEDARVKLYRSAEGDSNTNFLDSLVNRIANENFGDASIFSIDKISIDGLVFDFLDSLNGKHHRFDILQSQIAVNRQLDTNFLHIRGDWFFRGLTFKFKNGPFLSDTKASVDLRVAAIRPDNLIELRPSSLSLAGNAFQIQGYLKPRGAGYLKLDLQSPGLLLSEARPLLAENLRSALHSYDIDRPIQTRFLLEGPLTSGRPQPIDLRFSVEDAIFASDALQFTGTQFEARYINNCDSSGIITPHTDCLTFDNFSGRLFDRFPFEGTYRAHDLKNPQVTVEGSAELSLEKTNDFLPKEQMKLNGGQASVDFSYYGTPRELTDSTVRHLDIQLEAHANIRDASISYLPNAIRFDHIFADLRFDESNLDLEGLRFDLKDTPFRVDGVLHDFIPFVFEKESRLRADLGIQTPQLQFDHFIKTKSPSSFRRRASDVSVKKNQTAGRIAHTLQRISDALEVSLRIRADQVIYRKLGASDVQLRARLPRSCPNSSGNRESCLIIDQLSALIYDDIPVEGSLFLSGLEDPQLRMDLQIQSPLKRLSRLLPPDKLAVRKGQLNMNLHYQGPLDNYFEQDQSLLASKLSGTIHLDSVSIQYLPQNYQLDHLNGQFSFDEKDLHIDALSFRINRNDIRAKGKIIRFLPFLFEDSRKLHAVLDVRTPNLNLDAFPAWVSKPPKKSSNTYSATPVSEVIKSAINRISGQLKMRADTLLYKDIHLTSVSFDSRFIDACEGERTAGGCFIFDTLSAKLFGSTPLEASLTVSNFDHPFFAIKGEIAMPLPDLNRMFPASQFEFLDGWMEVGFRYKGHLRNSQKDESALLNARFSGQANITGADFNFNPRGYKFRDVDADFAFNEKDLHIDGLQLFLNDNEIRARGEFPDFMSFVLLPDRTLQANMEIYAPHFSLNNFQAPKKHLQHSTSQEFEATPVTEVVNAALSNIEANLEVTFDTVSYRQFLAREISGKLLMNTDRVHFEKATMALAGGSFQINGSINNLQCNQPYIDIQAGFQQADIREIFHSFENFGQQKLTDNNIRGRMTADILFRAQADENYDLQPSSMEGHFDLKVVDGALLQLPALMSINGFIFKNRDMDAVRFATMENAFDLKGQDLFIDHFFVVSNVMTFGVEGVYSLGNTQDTDLLFEVPLANLFHRNFDVEAMEGIDDRLRGISILLRANEGEEGSLKFKLVFSRKRN